MLSHSPVSCILATYYMQMASLCVWLQSLNRKPIVPGTLTLHLLAFSQKHSKLIPARKVLSGCNPNFKIFLWPPPTQSIHTLGRNTCSLTLLVVITVLNISALVAQGLPAYQFTNNMQKQNMSRATHYLPIVDDANKVWLNQSKEYSPLKPTSFLPSYLTAHH